MVAALLVLGGWLQGLPTAASTVNVPLRVRVYADSGVDRSTIDRVQDVTRRLLASAGIDLAWRLCEPLITCDMQSRPPREVTVILSRQGLSGRSENCGRAAVGPAGAGTVRVSVPCVADVVARLASRRGGAVHPLLKLAGYDDVLGAVVAHELGHVLGLQHARGVMRARLDPTDIVALRLGTLAFSPSQSARMRTLLAEQQGEALAEVPYASRQGSTR